MRWWQCACRLCGKVFGSTGNGVLRRIDGVSGMRSLDTSVSTLLSSMTVFIDSIHSASMSPSRMTHLGTCSVGPVAFLKSRMILAMMPSYGSFVTGCTQP